MRILHVIHRFYPAQGGAEHLMGKISTGLARAGHDVQVVTSDCLDYELFWDPGRRRIQARSDRYHDVAIRRFPVGHLPQSSLAFPVIRRLLWLLSSTKVTPLNWIDRLSRYAPWMPELQKWADTENQPFDLVAAMTITFDPIFAAAARLAKRQQVPFVAYPLTHLGAGDRPGQDRISRFYTMRHQTRLVTDTDALVALTTTEANFYLERGQAADRIRVISPGIDPEEFGGGDGDSFKVKHELSGPFILSIGAMSREKGMIQLVEAVRRVWANSRSVDLVLIGEVRSAFQHYLNELPVVDRQRIHLLGSVPEEEKRNALAAASVFSLTSITESFGIVYLEAWMHGLPVIGANTWATKDVVTHGENGLLVPFGDVDSLAQALSTLLDDPEMAHEMGQNGKQKVLRKHIWSQQFQVIQELYNSLV